MVVLFAGCGKSSPETVHPAYDIILIAGQSNTYWGQGQDLEVDTGHPAVLQMARSESEDKALIPANDPLDHWHRKENCIGFAMTFARLYANEMLEPNRKLVLVPCGFSGSSFSDERWNPGNDLYRDAVRRCQTLLLASENARLVAILWHQGEYDVDNPYYESQLDHMITSMRQDLYDPSQSIPFIAGGMVPYWVSLNPSRIETQGIIRRIPDRLPNCAYVDPGFPYLIQKPDNNVDTIHYDANGQRELGRRYYDAFLMFH